MAALLFIPYTLALLALGWASYTDFKTREVPDWLNFSLVASGIGINLIFSLVFLDFSYIANSLLGFGLFFLLGMLMFYTGQWGGGDSKMLMGLGALLGLGLFDKLTFSEVELFSSFPLFFSFFINLLLVGAVYGLVWSFSLAFLNSKSFLQEFKRINKSKDIMLWKKIIIVALAIAFGLIFFIQNPAVKVPLASAALLAAITFYLVLFIKAIEHSCMLRRVAPNVLTEGDWVAEDVKYRGKVIASPKDLGVSKEQIKKLSLLYRQKKIKMVLMKVGIPFIPSFFLAFVVTLAYGNLILMFV
ncbi:prepilin peptidase [Candidatus Woesearchaeota archaeon]|nr:prepilin peptidase [Candidatus Woesearchaeota archaeon]